LFRNEVVADIVSRRFDGADARLLVYRDRKSILTAVTDDSPHWLPPKINIRTQNYDPHTDQFRHLV
jgi:hypothetical protein